MLSHCRQKQGSMCAPDPHQGQTCTPRQELDLKQMRVKQRLGGKKCLPGWEGLLQQHLLDEL